MTRTVVLLTGPFVSGVEAHLNDERWAHTTEERNELAGLRFDVLETIAQPSRVLEGTHGALLGVREVEAGKWLVAVCR